jgi:exosortase/archaeosortase family protein
MSRLSGLASRRDLIAGRLVGVVGLSIGGYVLLAEPVRRLEASVVNRLLTLFGFESSSAIDGVVVMYPRGQPILGVVTTACSSLTAVLAMATIALFVMPGRLRRRAAAALCAGGTIALANLCRLTVSAVCGSMWGERGLVLFHDWVGVTFAMAYTVLGLAIVLAFFMPWRTQDERRYGDAL